MIRSLKGSRLSWAAINTAKFVKLLELKVISNAPAATGADDALIVSGCRAGDIEAKAEFVRRFKTSVFRRMYRYCGRRELAEDLTQETLLRALTRLEGFRENITLGGWVHRIGMNLLHDHYRSERVHKESPLEPDWAACADTGAVGVDVSLIAAEERRLLNAAVAALPEIYREVILLVYYNDFSVEEIARTLSLGLSAVKMRLQRGRAMLAKAMEENNG